MTIAQKEYIIATSQSRSDKKSCFRHKGTREVLDQKKTERNVQRYLQTRKIQGEFIHNKYINIHMLLFVLY